MPIVGNNIIVGGANPPTEIATSDTATETVELEDSKYVQKVDGELVRHINKKSTYLRDMLELLD